VFSEEMGMQFGIDKCAVIMMKRDKLKESNDITLPDTQVIQNVKE